MRTILLRRPACDGLDLGCSLEHGAFERLPGSRLPRLVRVSTNDQSLELDPKNKNAVEQLKRLEH